MSKKAKIIYNPLAGSMRGRIPPLKKLSLKSLGQIYVPKQSNEEIIQTIEETLHDAGYTHDIFLSTGRGSSIKAAQEAVAQGFDLIIAAGGDGTINEVVNGMAGASIPMGVLPLGTANSFAAELDIPFDLKEALEIIISGETKKIDLGLANKRYFTIATGIGFDAAAIKEVRPGLKRWFGSFAYLLAVLKTLVTYRFKKLEIEIPELAEKRIGYFCMICNTRSYAGSYELTANAVIDDGKFDLLIFKGKNASRMLLHLLKLAIGIFSPLKNYDIDYMKVREVRVKSAKPVPLHVDGEIIGNTPLVATIQPKALSVKVRNQ